MKKQVRGFKDRAQCGEVELGRDGCSRAASLAVSQAYRGTSGDKSNFRLLHSPAIQTELNSFL